MARQTHHSVLIINFDKLWIMVSERAWNKKIQLDRLHQTVIKVEKLPRVWIFWSIPVPPASGVTSLCGPKKVVQHWRTSPRNWITRLWIWRSWLSLFWTFWSQSTVDKNIYYFVISPWKGRPYLWYLDFQIQSRL